MRVIVMLKPTNKYGTKMEYSKFRKYLSQEGFFACSIGSIYKNSIIS